MPGLKTIHFVQSNAKFVETCSNNLFGDNLTNDGAKARSHSKSETENDEGERSSSESTAYHGNMEKNMQ